MMTNSGGILKPERPGGRTGPRPRLKAARIGIVSRDYRHKYENGFRDFSEVFPRVLRLLDEQRCDTVLFSSFSIVPRPSFRPLDHVRNLRYIKAVLYEEFSGRRFIRGKWKKGKQAKSRYVVLHRKANEWHKYKYRQVLGSLNPSKEERRAAKDEGKTVKKWIGVKIDRLRKEMPRRMSGNCCLILCGETNAVKYSPRDKSVNDDLEVRSAIPEGANLILNPIHDRMTRFEMLLKRAFLSRNGRWVISVWNKGKVDSKGRVRDGSRPAWSVFHNGKKKEIEPIEEKELSQYQISQDDLEVGILSILKR